MLDQHPELDWTQIHQNSWIWGSERKIQLLHRWSFSVKMYDIPLPHIYTLNKCILGVYSQRKLPRYLFIYSKQFVKQWTWLKTIEDINGSNISCRQKYLLIALQAAG